jgi:hypothetical protein
MGGGSASNGERGVVLGVREKRPHGLFQVDTAGGLEQNGGVGRVPFWTAKDIIGGFLRGGTLNYFFRAGFARGGGKPPRAKPNSNHAIGNVRGMRSGFFVLSLGVRAQLEHISQNGNLLLLGQFPQSL